MPTHLGAARAVLSLIREFDAGRGALLEGSSDQVATGSETIAGETRAVLFVHPPAAVTFRVPARASRLSFGIAMHPSVWQETRTGPTDFLVLLGEDPVFRQTLDVRRCVEDRRWHDAVIELPDECNGEQLVTLVTRAPTTDFRWALFSDLSVECESEDGDPKSASVLAPHVQPPRVDLDRLEQLATHPDNLTFNLYRELMYWNNELRGGENPYLADRLDAQSDGVRACPQRILDLVDQETARLGRKPRVLDFGSGPFSTLIYLHRRDLAEVVTIDALSSEYGRLLAEHGIEWPLTPRRGTGEFLRQQHPGACFDIVFVSNALDHTQCPALTWMNLFQVTALGGVLAHRHAVREATYESYDQLHQFDLYPEDASLWITDATGHAFSLTDGLPLECIGHERYLMAKHEWFEAAYRKTANEIRCSTWHADVLAQLARTFRKRNAWAATLERFMNSSLDLRHRFNGLPFYVEHPER